MSDYVLYGSPASYFTGKVRGYLRWKGVAFDEQPATTQVMKEVILPSVGWPVIPVIKTPDGRVVQDTADIIAEVERAESGPAVLPAGGVQAFASLLFELLGDQWFGRPAMHYRWNYNEEWIYSEFGRSSAPDAAPDEQYRLGKERGQKFRGMVPMLGVTAATIPGIEKSYEQFLEQFSVHLSEHDYLLGGQASLGDFALLGPLYAHLYRDPASGELMERLAPKVARWVERTIEGAATTGSLVAHDAVPQTLVPILASHCQEHLPVIEATNTMLEAWATTAKAGDELPRAFEMTEFTVGGCTGQCLTGTFSLLRLQSALDCLNALAGDERLRAESLLDQMGAGMLKTFRVARRLERRNCRLVLAA